MMEHNIDLLWQETLATMQNKISRQAFNTWVSAMKPLLIQNNTIYIEVPNHFSRDWLNERYAPLIKSTINDLLKQECDLQFILEGDNIPDNSTLTSNRVNNWSLKDGPVHSYLNPKYTFDTFVVGNSNRFAHAASMAVAESPAKSYNPFFIYGGVGLGKTHLMHAIGQFIRNQSKHNRVSYVTSEKFTNELINSIRDDKTVEFRNRYRNMEVLLIDDIQFLAGKERTQEEFFHTFNTLYEANRQIIISSDRPPKDIPTLEDRLRSRFEWGLITDIQPPDLETRIAILRKKAQLEGLSVPDGTIAYIADNIQSNIRELEGALVRVIAYRNLNGEEVTPEMAATVLKDILPTKKPTLITIPLIQQVVTGYYNLRPDDFKSKKRNRSVSYPRQIAMYLSRELTDCSLPKIGELFGGRDHTTVIHAYDKIALELSKDPNLVSILNELTIKIKNS